MENKEPPAEGGSSGVQSVSLGPQQTASGKDPERSSQDLSPWPWRKGSTPRLATASRQRSGLTFLVLQPQLLLHLLAGEVDDAGELGAVEGLGDVMGAVVLDEGQQLLPAALLGQDLEDIGEAWTKEGCREGVRCGRQAAGQLQAAKGSFQ